MNILPFSNMLSKLIKPDTSLPPGSPYFLSGRRLGRQGLTDAQGNKEEIFDAFCSYAFACINVRAKTIANAGKLGVFRVKVRRGTNKFGDVPFDHPLVQLLEMPNPHMSRYELWYLTEVYMDLFGNSYWWLARDKFNVPRVIWPLPAQVVTQIVPSNGENGKLIKAYVIEWDRQHRFEIPEQDIVQLKHPNPKDPYFYGSSLLLRAAAEIDIDVSITAHQRDFFINDATPASVITFPTVLSAIARKAFEKNWLEKFNRKPGQVGYLEGGASMTVLQNQKELDYIKSADRNWIKLKAIFGVPDSKLMNEEHIVARPTLETLDYNFLKETIEPELTIIDEQLTIDLATEFDKKLVIVHDTVIPRDIMRESEIDARELAMGRRSINEVRERDGLAPYKGGEEPLIEFGKVPLSHAGTTVIANPPPDGKSLDSVSEAVAFKCWKAFDRNSRLFELRVTRTMLGLLYRVEDDVQENLRAQKSFDVDQIVFDVKKWANEFASVLGLQSVSMIREAFEQFVRENLLDNVLFNPLDDNLRRNLMMLIRKTKTIPATLRDELYNAVREGISLNETIDQLSQRIHSFFMDTNPYRATRVAKTVSVFAVNAGNNIAAVQSKVFTKKAWITQHDILVRDIHAPLHLHVININEKFKLNNGDSLDYAGDPKGLPASVINCRCTNLYKR